MDRAIVRVAEVTRRELHMVNGLASVEDAIAEMQRHGVSSLVIERRHAGDEFGIVTVRDIAALVLARGRSTERTSVYEIMTKPAITLSADMNAKYAIRLLARLGVGRALVTRGDELLGLVTLRDLVLAHAGPGEGEA